MKKEINIISFLNEKHAGSFINDQIKSVFSDFNLLEVSETETFYNTLLNWNVDLVIISENCDHKSGLDQIINLKMEDIAVPFIPILEVDDEDIISRVVELGGFDFILEKEEKAFIKRKLNFIRSKILFTRQNEESHPKNGLDVKFDATTGLLNRQEFLKHLINGRMKSILLVDIDDFNLINLAYGIEVGDYILKSMASLLKENMKEAMDVFRIAGDEFIILIDDPKPNEEKVIAEKVIQLFSMTTFAYETLELKVSVTIGVARGDSSHLLRDADVALRRARKISKNRYEEYYYDSLLEEKQKQNLIWANRIKRALDEDCFVPYFQPIFNNKTQKIEKYECLARMIYEGAVITPDQFLEPAKRSGLLPHLTKVMIIKCFSVFEKNEYDFSINISDIDLKYNYLVDFLQEKLVEYNIRPDRFIIEISEDIQSSNIQDEVLQILRLKELGIKIAFDDFGTGYSNFSRLLEFKADFIKIDGSFIKYLDINGQSYKISHAISEFGKSIETEIIAEFVHSKAIYEKVKELKINYSQGYYFGKPAQSIDKTL